MREPPSGRFGMTTNASSTIGSRTVSLRRHSSTTMRPSGLRTMRPCTIRPNRHRFRCVLVVTKYAATDRSSKDGWPGLVRFGMVRVEEGNGPVLYRHMSGRTHNDGQICKRPMGVPPM